MVKTSLPAITSFSGTTGATKSAAPAGSISSSSDTAAAALTKATGAFLTTTATSTPVVTSNATKLATARTVTSKSRNPTRPCTNSSGLGIEED
ncbi:hypothetical protein LTR08_001185 [Meristemomyces frigidus]|nr:hypothetical protein LTR08_001185 [Meristemomyces frigidus]